MGEHYTRINEELYNQLPLPDRLKHRVHVIRGGSVYPRHQSIVTAFVALSMAAFLVVYLEVSRVLMPTVVLSQTELRRLTRGFAQDIPSEKEQSQQPLLALRRQKPSAIVIGFSHCGADQILDELNLHPDIIINPNNLHLLDGNLTDQLYVSKMPLALPHHTTVDVCLECIEDSTALQSIARMDKHVKAIVVVCDPLIRLFSHIVSSHELPKSSHNHSQSHKQRTQPMMNGSELLDNYFKKETHSHRIVKRSGVHPQAENFSTSKLKASFTQRRNDHGVEIGFNASLGLQISANESSKKDHEKTQLIQSAITNKDDIPARESNTRISTVSSQNEHFLEMDQTDTQSKRENITILPNLFNTLHLVLESILSENRTLNNSNIYARKMSGYLEHISNVIKQFHDKQVYIVEREVFHTSKDRHIKRLFEFLKVKKVSQEGKYYTDSYSNMTKSDKRNYSDIQILFDVWRRQNKELHEKLVSYFTDSKKELLSYLKNNEPS